MKTILKILFYIAIAVLVQACRPDTQSLFGLKIFFGGLAVLFTAIGLIQIFIGLDKQFRKELLK